ncbi:subclass B3 metallo-beta-lactamase [Pseudochryseolinea flava]|uniref:Subclass B3 metallo-beta-lactamase n=1 Tax=Pseudochryseolinea flava TaxID=2059302 RepID=A0A364Y2M2_9BACT|nr:subclass B3 metallo-beta-lactamase [Pseudochryseolinea flava]RAW01115.1 subclass B3 metallo-beta-lactamase [Pseudochryseolinea flava]
MSRFRLCLLGTYLSLALTLPTFAQNGISLYADSSWTKPYEPFRIAGDVYYVGTYDLACYLITTSEGNVLINTGMPSSVAMIRKSIETLGFKFSDLKILLTTQAHYDHMGAMAEIRKLTNAKMMVHQGDSSVTADGGNSDFLFGGKGAMYPPVPVDRVLKDKETITLGGTKILVLHHPGHTKGATSYLVETKDSKRSWKVLIANMPSILEQTRIFGMPTYPNVGKDYAYTLKSLKSLQFDLWVASHASQFNLHEKRKEGDTYNPSVFGNLKEYDAAVKGYQGDYDKRIKEEKR